MILKRSPQNTITLADALNGVEGSAETIASNRGMPAKNAVEGGSNNSSFESLSGHQFGDPPARVKHTCFDGVLRDARDVGDLIDRFLMVIDQVDDLTMRRRQLC